MKFNLKLIIILIGLLTLATRLPQLEAVPPHLSNDEISIAYDAYSVSQTLKDEHNHFLPLSFQSHGTYKAPLTIYLSIPTTLLFGNQETSVRLPSALLGSLTVLLLGLLTYELSQKNLPLALLASFFLAASPWHIYTSRMALESNLALFFVIGGLWLFFQNLHRPNRFLPLASAFFFALSVYSYHTEWLLTPLILALLFFLHCQQILKNRFFLLAAGLFLILISPLFLDFLSNLGTTARANTEIIFKERNLHYLLQEANLNPLQKGQVILQAILGSYLSYLDPGYLFFDGLRLFPEKEPFQSGLFLAGLLPFFFLGFLKLKKIYPSNWKFILIWALASPLVPAFTQGGPNLVRNLATVAPYTLIAAAGLFSAWEYLKTRRLPLYSTALVLLISFVNFYLLYFYHFPIQSGEGFQYGYKQIAEYLNSHTGQYQKIVVDPHFGPNSLYDGVPHLYLSYFTNLDPRQMLQRQNLPTGLYFDKYEIRQINWEEEVLSQGSLYIVPFANQPPPSIAPNLHHLLEIRLPDFQPAFDLYSP